MEKAHERKRLKYTDLVENCIANGWKTWCFPVEIGCRGFPGNALWRAFKMLGIVGKERRTTIEEAGRKAETASLWIWRKRNDRTWAKEAGERAENNQEGQHESGCASAREPIVDECNPNCQGRPQERMTTFKGKHDVLSNFYPCRVHVFERTFKSSEHAYQYMKAKYYGEDRLAEEIFREHSACVVKRMAKRITTEEEWEEEKLEIMRQIIRAKARSVARYRNALLDAE